jgi:uncharacterized membrane protein YdcZ (DUF606 family)
MLWNLVDQLILITGIIILMAIIDTVLTILKKEHYLNWINFIGIAIILGIVLREIFLFLSDLRRLLHRL